MLLCVAPYRRPSSVRAQPPDDPRAIGSRRDLLRINGVMRQGAVMARLLADFPAPSLLVDLGGGDGRFMLGVAKRLAKRWQGVTVMIADLELHAPTLDDVFLAKTGRTLEGATEDAETAGQEKRQR